jgi:hypothetical protein
VVLLPNGKPAADAQVVYIGPHEQAGMLARGEISSHHLRPGSETRTDAGGRFRFVPKLGACEIVTLNSEGLIRFAAADLATNSKVVLQPWSRVSGRLVRDGQPVSGEHVDLKPTVDYDGRHPWVNFHGTRTDEAGRFTIERVPPGDWYLTTRVKTGYGGWTNQRQHSFRANPRESAEAGTIQKNDPKAPLH